jgi:hypothetical protein
MIEMLMIGIREFVTRDITVEDLVQRIRDGRTGRVLRDRTIERSNDAVCSVHRTQGGEEHGFLG